MYVANTTYKTTPWVVPWMHTQLGAGGSSAVGTAAGLRALMRKGKIKDEQINVITFCGDLGGGDMGLGGISAALHSDYDLLIILYDNESSANTDIQQQARRPTARRRPSRRREPSTDHAQALEEEHRRHACRRPSDLPLRCHCLRHLSADGLLNKVRKALAIGGPTFIHTYDPCPKGWDYHPRYSNELGELGIKCGIYPLYEIVDGNVIYTWDARKTGKGRIPVKEFISKQGRFDHLKEEHYAHIQNMVDQMWEEWQIPGVAPLRGILKARI